MTSTHDLISHIPGYMVEILSMHILGKSVDTQKLAEGLSDEDRLREILAGLTDRQRSLLSDLYELGGIVTWEVLTSVYIHGLAELKEDLTFLGGKGFVFQGGLSGRDPIILLPSLYSHLEEMRKRSVVRADEVVWEKPRQVSIWGHVSLLNTLRSSLIRCRSGMEPFKRGWEFLEERLGSMLDLERIYWELVELGCVKEKKGVLCVSQQASSEFAMDGDARYPLWRFIQSCRNHPGLEHRVFSVLLDKAVSRDFVSRSLELFLISRDPEEAGGRQMVDALIELWISLGILQQDSSGMWVRFVDPVYRCLKTGKIEPSQRPYCEEIVLQPNMEILVPGDFDPMDLLNLGEMADLVQTDVMSIYRITKRSISRAMREGWDVEKVRSFLGRISRHEVPDNVCKTIEGWAAMNAEAYILKGTFLFLSGPDCKISRGLKEVLPGIYRVPDNCEEEVAALLDKKDVIVRGIDYERENEEGASWGKLVPFQYVQKVQWKEPRKEGIFPFGMVSPLPYGAKGEGVFEKALSDGRPVIIFYPRQGYGEIEVKKISPIYIYRKGGVPFVEAFCEDTGEGEIFDITKVRAMLKNV